MVDINHNKDNSTRKEYQENQRELSIIDYQNAIINCRLAYCIVATCNCFICKIRAELELQLAIIYTAARESLKKLPAMQEELRQFTEALMRKYRPPGEAKEGKQEQSGGKGSEG